MSWDINLVTTLDGHEIEIPATAFNYTHNTNGMLYDAGFPHWMSMNGASAGAFCRLLGTVVERLKADPDKYETMNPENGYGNYRGLLRVLDDVMTVFGRYPSAIVKVSA